MSRKLGQCRGQVALIDAAEAGKAAGAVDQHFIPDAARILVDHAVFGEIEIGREIGDDIVGIVGDAFARVVVKAALFV
jgi:hypothetical protein